MTACTPYPNTRPTEYGRVRVEGRTRLAHRLAWEKANGPIPAGMYVCHRCDNPPCVNVAHLFLGTHADNLRDASRKGRMHPGSRHGMARLTEAQVTEIKRDRAAGVSGADLGRRFGVSPNTIYHIGKGRTWNHV